MMRILMTMISKKVFTSSNYRLFMLPAFTQAFLLKSSPSGELSYRIKKTVFEKNLFKYCCTGTIFTSSFYTRKLPVISLLIT